MSDRGILLRDDFGRPVGPSWFVRGARWVGVQWTKEHTMKIELNEEAIVPVVVWALAFAAVVAIMTVVWARNHGTDQMVAGHYCEWFRDFGARGAEKVWVPCATIPMLHHDELEVARRQAEAAWNNWQAEMAYKAREYHAAVAAWNTVEAARLKVEAARHGAAPDVKKP